MKTGAQNNSLDWVPAFAGMTARTEGSWDKRNLHSLPLRTTDVSPWISSPAVYKDKLAAVNQATGVVQELFAENVFPEIKADWRAQPNHIGHLYSDGCFRCHDGLHKSPDGKVLTNDCSACHQILTQGSAVSRAVHTMVGARHALPLRSVWQRNYYERIIRNDTGLQRARQYIADNPAH